VIALACGAALAILDLLGLFAGADLKLLDWRFQLRGPQPTSDLLALVAIDDATIGAFEDRWPLPREYEAAMIGALGEAGARAIGLDLLFLGPDPCDPHSDSLLVLASRSESGVVHSFTFPPVDLTGQSPVPSPIEPGLLRHGIPYAGGEIARAERVATPFPALLAVSRNLGHISVSIDRDGVVRRVPLFLRYGDQVYPALAMSLFDAGLENGQPPSLKPAHGGVELTWRSGRKMFVPVDREGATGI